MRLDKAVSLFLGGHKPTTRQAYAHALIPMRDWVGPARDLASIKPALLVEYWETVAAHGYAPATERKLAKGIKTFFNWCVRLEELSRSPAGVLKAPKIPRLISRAKAMTDAELARLLDDLAHKTIPRDYALVLLLSETGIRIGGAAGLRLGDLQWDTLRAVNIVEKGHEPRWAPFSAGCATALQRWISYRGAHYTLTGVYVFSRDGSPPAARVLSQAVRRACLRVGVRSLGPHALRHRKGQQFSDNGVSVAVAAAGLGITVGVMLDHYYQTDLETAEKEMRKLMAVEAEPPNIVPLKRLTGD